MLNLQTVAESLAAKCNGQAWIFVTSQASLEGLIGNFKDANAEQISKIQGRFKTKLTLASSDVKEVIRLPRSALRPPLLLDLQLERRRLA
jgi:hypothetical protein